MNNYFKSFTEEIRMQLRKIFILNEFSVAVITLLPLQKYNLHLISKDYLSEYFTKIASII